jgi:hypothetical protein
VFCHRMAAQALHRCLRQQEGRYSLPLLLVLLRAPGVRIEVTRFGSEALGPGSVKIQGGLVYKVALEQSSINSYGILFQHSTIKYQGRHGNHGKVKVLVIKL